MSAVLNQIQSVLPVPLDGLTQGIGLWVYLQMFHPNLSTTDRLAIVAVPSVVHGILHPIICSKN